MNTTIYGTPLRGSAYIDETSPMYSPDVTKIVDALRTNGIVDRDADITVTLHMTGRNTGVARAIWAVST